MESEFICWVDWHFITKSMRKHVLDRLKPYQATILSVIKVETNYLDNWIITRSQWNVLERFSKFADFYFHGFKFESSDMASN